MSIEPVAAAAQACSNQTSNLLANWKCSFTVAHPSTVQTGGGPALHSALPVFIIGALIGLFLITMSKSRGRSAPASR